MSFLRKLVGYREDLALGGRWWHRLAGVLYVVAFSALSIFVLWRVVNSSRPARELANVKVLESFPSLYRADYKPSTNLMQVLADVDGEFGMSQKDGSIAYLNEYFMERSFCSTHVLQAPEALAAHFNRINYTGAETVMAGPLKGVEPSQDGLCWFDNTVRELLKAETAAGDIIAYEFTPQAKVRAAGGPVAQAVGALFVLHLLLTTMYYRGFLYVVCGPHSELL